VDHKGQEQIALHRWAVIAEAAGPQLTPAERGALARQIAARSHPHPDGSSRRYSRGTIDRWLRAWRKDGLDALKPSLRADAGVVRAHPELFAEAAALRLELPGRSAAQIASILYHRHGITVSERTVRGQLRGPGCTARPWLPSRRPTAGTRPPGRTSGGSPTCWSARGCRTRDGRVGPGPAVPHRRRSLPAAGRRPVLRARERPRLPGPAAPGDHPPRCAGCAVCGQRGAVLQRVAGQDVRGAGYPAGA
jgi:transposase